MATNLLPKDAKLFNAVQDGDAAQVEQLIRQGADVNTQQGIARLTPLMQAALNNDAGLARMLIDAGADVNRLKRDGGTAVILAGSLGHIEVFRILAENGADLSVKNGNGVDAFTDCDEDVRAQLLAVQQDIEAAKQAKKQHEKDARNAEMAQEAGRNDMLRDRLRKRTTKKLGL